MALVVVRIEVLAVPTRREEDLRAHLFAGLLVELNVVPAWVGADVRDGAIGKVILVIGSMVKVNG